MKILLTTLLLVLLTPAIATAHDFEVDGIYYNINGNEATVTYKGSSLSSAAYSGEVVIPQAVIYNGLTFPVTKIDHYAFYKCNNLTSISLPNSITSIDYCAFSYCTNITSVEIPNSVIHISSGAFYGCNNIIRMTVESNNPEYDSRDNCNAIIISSNNKLIAGCKNTVIPNSVTVIGSEAFLGYSDLISIYIPNSVGIIGWGAFRECGFTSINLPNSVTTIDNLAFLGCNELTSISIPNSVTTIKGSTFSGCTGLTKVDIGNSITFIDDWAFQNCNNLTNVYCYATIPPTCNEKTFTSYSATLHVPATSLAAYFTAPVWCNFENIVGDAIEPIDISISNDSVEVNLGGLLELTATVSPANASTKEVIWYSTDKRVATVDGGSVIAVGCGECDVIASCFGMQVSCHITVFNQIFLDQEVAMLLPNHMLTLTTNAIVMPDGFIVTSSDPTVAAARVMNGKVQVVGIKEGTTTITVGSTDGTAIPATCLVTVYTEPGDLNCDGFTNISDVTQIIDYLLSGDASNIKLENADVNADGMVNIGDVTALIDKLLSSN